MTHNALAAHAATRSALEPDPDLVTWTPDRHGRPSPVGLIGAPESAARRFKVCVVGDARIDVRATLRRLQFADVVRDHHEPMPVDTSIGGTAVGFAVAGVAHFAEVTLIAAVGDDGWTDRIRRRLEGLGVVACLQVVPDVPNAVVLVIRDAAGSGGTAGTRLLIAQAPAPYDDLDTALVAGHRWAIDSADALVVDGYALLAPRSAAAVDLAMSLAHRSGVPIWFDVVPHRIDERFSLAELAPWLERASLVTVEAPTLARLCDVPVRDSYDDGSVLSLVEGLPDRLRASGRTWFVRYGLGNMDRTVAVGPGRYRTAYATGYAHAAEPTGYGYRVGAAELKWWLLNAASAPGMALLCAGLGRSCVRPELLAAASWGTR